VAEGEIVNGVTSDATVFGVMVAMSIVLIIAIFALVVVAIGNARNRWRIEFEKDLGKEEGEEDK
jgi:hypothetical protein